MDSSRIESVLRSVKGLKDAVDDDTRTYLCAMMSDNTAALGDTDSLMDTIGPFLEAAGLDSDAARRACADVVKRLGGGGGDSGVKVTAAAASSGSGSGSSATATAPSTAASSSSSSSRRRRRRGKDASAEVPAPGAAVPPTPPAAATTATTAAAAKPATDEDDGLPRRLDGPMTLGSLSRRGDAEMTAFLWGKSKEDRSAQANQNSILELSDADAAKAAKRAEKERRRADAEERRRRAEADEDAELSGAPVLKGGDGVSRAQDVHIHTFSMSFGPRILLENASLKFIQGHRYGLVGRNGMGKTTLLRHISSGQVEGFPKDIRVMHVEQEVVGNSATVLECVLRSDSRREGLLQREKELLAMMDHADKFDSAVASTAKDGEAAGDADGEATVTTTSTAAATDASATPSTSTTSRAPSSRRRKRAAGGAGAGAGAGAGSASGASAGAGAGSGKGAAGSAPDAVKPSADPAGELAAVYEKLEMLDSSTAESRAAAILAGLQFSPEMQVMTTNELSGGWRMRVALACALFVRPELLLLDEPTNHLDFPAVAWLEEYLLTLPSTLVVVSHDRSFLNTVTTDIMHLYRRTLIYYKGDYDTFERTRAERRRHQQSAYESLEAKKKHMQAFIDKFRFNAKRASLVQSRIKAVERLGSVAEVVDDPQWRFTFPDPGPLGVPMLQVVDVTFGYDPKKPLFREASFGVHMDSRIAILGKNGVGKSTLVNLITGELNPQEGHVSRNSKLRVATFTQHHIKQLDLKSTPMEYLAAQFPGNKADAVRAHLGRFGLSGDLATQTIGTLSGGQKSRVAFAQMTWRKPHLLIMDEPTNHLDLETIDALILAVGEFGGGLVLVSHDAHFISSVADELWVVEPGVVRRFRGDLEAYRKEALLEFTS